MTSDEQQRLEAIKAAIQIAAMTPRFSAPGGSAYHTPLPSTAPTADEIVKSAKTILSFLSDAKPDSGYDTVLATQGTASSSDFKTLHFPYGCQIDFPGSIQPSTRYMQPVIVSGKDMRVV